MEIGVAAALVLIAFLFVARFNASTGTVTVTVNMSAFSPPLVKVGSPATTTLSATIGSNYNPPVPSPDEGSLSDTYKWTLTLLFSPTASGTYSSAGAPGTQNYYLSPKPLPSSGTIPVTLTPERPGYWEPSASCTVTVKDSKNANLTWTGSGDAGPAKLTSYTLDITYTGPVVGGASDKGTVVTGKTENVHAGWPIQLGVKLEPSDMADAFTWAIEGAGGNGAAAIAGWNPTKGFTWVSPLNPASPSGIYSFGYPYYYVAAGDHNASATPQGVGVPPAWTTFSVAKPSSETLTTTTSVVCGGTDRDKGVGAMDFGDAFLVNNDPGSPYPQPYQDGIDCHAKPGQIAGFSGKFDWAQVYSLSQVYFDSKGNPLGSAYGEGLDPSFPYPSLGTFQTNDNPAAAPSDVPASDGDAFKITVADHATMWLLYKPPISGSIWVPVDSVNWNWGARISFWGVTGELAAHRRHRILRVPQQINIPSGMVCYLGSRNRTVELKLLLEHQASPT